MVWWVDAVACVLLLLSTYTDIRWRRVKNGVVLLFGCLGLLVRGIGGGSQAIAVGLVGASLGLLWWLAVAWARLGPGDAKLAMALGAILGPVGGLFVPALGTVLASVTLWPWLIWRRVRTRRWPWRAELPLVPWIAAAFVVWVGAAVLHVPT